MRVVGCSHLFTFPCFVTRFPTALYIYVRMLQNKIIKHVQAYKIYTMCLDSYYVCSPYIVLLDNNYNHTSHML